MSEITGVSLKLSSQRRAFLGEVRLSSRYAKITYVPTPAVGREQTYIPSFKDVFSKPTRAASTAGEGRGIG
jgi:hypothetical protein